MMEKYWMTGYFSNIDKYDKRVHSRRNPNRPDPNHRPLLKYTSKPGFTMLNAIFL